MKLGEYQSELINEILLEVDKIYEKYISLAENDSETEKIYDRISVLVRLIKESD